MADLKGDVHMAVVEEPGSSGEEGNVTGMVLGAGVKCPDCEKVFTRASSLVAHRRLHTGERPYACSVCDRTFSDKSNLRSHIKIHTVKEKLFSCEICAKSFAMKRYLHKHRQTHSEWNPCVSNTDCNNARGKLAAVDRTHRANRKEIIVLPPPKSLKQVNQEIKVDAAKIHVPVVNVKVQTPTKPTQPIFVNKSPKKNSLTVSYACKIIKQQMPDGTIAHFMDDGHKLTPVTLVSVDNNIQQAVFKPITAPNVSKNSSVFELNNPRKRPASEITDNISQQTQMKHLKGEHISGDDPTNSHTLSEIRVSNPKFQSNDSQSDTDNGSTPGNILSKDKQVLAKNVHALVSSIDGSNTALLNTNSQSLSFAGISSVCSQTMSDNQNGLSITDQAPSRNIPSLSELALSCVTPVVQNIQLNTGGVPGISVPVPAGSLQALMKMLPARHEPTMTSIQTVDTDPLHDDVNVVSEQVDDSPESVLDSDEEGQLIIKQEIPDDDEGAMHMLNSGNDHSSSPQEPVVYVDTEPVDTVEEHVLETVVFPVGMEQVFHQGSSTQDIKVTEIQLGSTCIGAAGDGSVNSKAELIHCDEALLAKLLAGNVNPSDIVIIYPETSG